MKKKLIAVMLVVSTIMLGTACANETTGTQNGQDTDIVTDGATSNGEASTENAASDDADEKAEGDNSSAGDASSNDNVTNNETEEEAEKGWYEQMLDASIKFKGNNYRLKKVLEKARAGETINMATLGGSITEGAGASSNDNGYAYQFAEGFKNTYCSGDNLNFVNAGLSGTPSALGVMRYQKDVVDALGTVPDLLVIEFAVNDWQEATGGRALESLIYRALTDNEECAVIVLYSVSQGKWNMQNDMNPYAMYYGVPSISILDAITSTTEVSDLSFFSDEYHPRTYGHTIMSDCLMNFLDVVDKADENNPFAVPEAAKKGRQFANMTLVTDSTSGVNVSKGGFGATDTNIQTCYFTKEGCFPDNYMNDGSSNSAMSVKLTCQTLLLDYKTANDSSFGSADVYVDGVLVTTLNGNSSGGWNNNNVVLIIDDTESKQHTVEVKMAAGSEGKKFTVLAMAYN